MDGGVSLIIKSNRSHRTGEEIEHEGQAYIVATCNWSEQSKSFEVRAVDKKMQMRLDVFR